MRSRSNSLEDTAKAKLAQQQARSQRRATEREEPQGRGAGRARLREPPDDTGTNTGTVQRKEKEGSGSSGSGSASSNSRREKAAGGKARDLSRDDLLFLLSMLEGELQVRRDCGTGQGLAGSGLFGEERLGDWARVWLFRGYLVRRGRSLGFLVILNHG